MAKRKITLKLLFEIYFTFFKLSCFSFGGGYAMIPLIEREVVEEKKWIEKEKIIDIFAASESLPGAIALNSAAFVAYDIAGIPGAVAALLGNLIPPLVIVLTLSVLFAQYSNHPLVKSGFQGVRPTVVGLIYYAAYKIGKSAIKDNLCRTIMLIAFLGLLFFHSHLHPVVVILFGAAAGIILSNYKKNNTMTQRMDTKQ